VRATDTSAETNDAPSDLRAPALPHAPAAAPVTAAASDPDAARRTATALAAAVLLVLALATLAGAALVLVASSGACTGETPDMARVFTAGVTCALLAALLAACAALHLAAALGPRWCWRRCAVCAPPSRRADARSSRLC
jgi:hypothetical protein